MSQNETDRLIMTCELSHIGLFFGLLKALGISIALKKDSVLKKH